MCTHASKSLSMWMSAPSFLWALFDERAAACCRRERCLYLSMLIVACLSVSLLHDHAFTGQPVSTCARLGGGELQEAQTHTPKRVSCLWLLVIIPGMSGLHLLMTHCFQDNHSGGKLERTPRHLREVVVMTPSLFKRWTGRGGAKTHTLTLTWSFTASPTLTTCCCR